MPLYFQWDCRDSLTESSALFNKFSQSLQTASLRFQGRCVLNVEDGGDIKAVLNDGAGQPIAAATFRVEENCVSWWADPTISHSLSPWFECSLGEHALSGMHGFKFSFEDDYLAIPDFHIRYPTPSDHQNSVASTSPSSRHIGAVIGAALDRLMGYGEGYRWLNTQLPPVSGNQSSPNPA